MASNGVARAPVTITSPAQRGARFPARLTPHSASSTLCRRHVGRVVASGAPASGLLANEGSVAGGFDSPSVGRATLRHVGIG